MLNLLSILDAALVLYSLNEKEDWKLAFNPERRRILIEDEKKQNDIWMFQIFIENAIKAGKLPAFEKSKGKSVDKKIFERLEIPSDMLDFIPQYNYWIKLEDFFVFIETAPSMMKEYAHGRDALVRLLCAVIDHDALNEKKLNEHLAHKIETAEQNLAVDLKLGDNTLKGCCREILDNLILSS